MRLDIYGLFVFDVTRPRGGSSKGRPVAFVQHGSDCYPADLLIPNGLSDSELERYVADKYRAFAIPGRQIRRLDPVQPAA